MSGGPQLPVTPALEGLPLSSVNTHTQVTLIHMDTHINENNYLIKIRSIYLLFIYFERCLSMYPWLACNLLCRPGWSQAHGNSPLSPPC